MFSNRSGKVFAFFSVIGLLAAAFLFGFAAGRSAPIPGSRDYALIKEAEDAIRTYGLHEADRKALTQGAVRGMLQSIDDPYAAYLDPVALQQADDVLSGHFSGVGLLLKQDGKLVDVISVLENTPAHAAGILQGDILTHINSRSLDNLSLDQVVSRLRGPGGSQVKIRLEREGHPPMEIALVREPFDLPSVASRMVPKQKMGLVEVVSFTRGVGGTVREAVRTLASEGAQGFILDLRGNPGGDFYEAIEVASVFLDGGPVVSSQSRIGPKVPYEARGRPETALPLVVLVDEGSASASEIVAGAIQDRGRGVIVGTETYGKGVIQQTYRLSDGSAVKLTTASYFTPSGRSIGENGVIPDVNVAGKQSQIARAQEVLKGILVQSTTAVG